MVDSVMKARQLGLQSHNLFGLEVLFFFISPSSAMSSKNKRKAVPESSPTLAGQTANKTKQRSRKEETLISKRRMDVRINLFKIKINKFKKIKKRKGNNKSTPLKSKLINIFYDSNY